MRRFLTGYVLMTLTVFAVPSVAQPVSMNGLCLDMREEGCTERYLPFSGLQIGFCEEMCVLTNPINVRGLEGALFDLACTGDSGDIPDRRVMIIRQTDFSSRTVLSWIDAFETLRIVPCP